jgi:predicted ATPase/DNA-binding winged helix-turn-helix (wHTH) protein
MDPLPGATAVIEFGRFKLLRHRRELLADGRPVELGGRAFDMLAALIEAGGAVLEKDELMSRVWPGRIVEENSLQAQISALRKALGVDRDLIRTVAGRGYQFTGEMRVLGVAGVPRRASNLPEPVSELIGRETAVSEVLDLVAAHRLVTLTGVGGIGKTRLGLEVARHLVPRFSDGVWFAEIGPLSDPELAPATVAVAAGLTLEQGTASADRVAAALGTRHLLLVLDNCEHVIEAAARMAEALLHASSVSCVLATSREPLRAEGEYVYRVPPLDVPAEDNLDMEDVLRHSAVRLFIARARAAEPQYVPDIRLAAAKASICRHLDGIPLAIELAAMRVASFGVEGVVARLDDRFRLLAGGNRTALPRHQTMRATLDWSYELLSDSLRVTLRRLAVFAGSFTLESASAVTMGTPPAVVDCPVANLVAKSLISADVAGPIVHYRLLETTRAYALAKLRESGELDDFKRRHAEYYRDLFERAEAEWETRPTAEWLAVYGHQIDNVRAALDWAFSPSGDAAVGVGLTAASVPLWFQLSLMDECRARVERALSSIGPGSNPDARRDMKLYAALGASLLYTRGAVLETGAAWTRTLEIAERLDNVEYQLRALWGLWAYRHLSGACRSALALAQRFSEFSAARGDSADLCVGDRMMGLSLHYLGDQRNARDHLERMLSRYVAPAYRSHRVRFVYDQTVIARSILAQILWLQGFPDQAIRVAQLVVEGARAMDHPPSLCWALAEGACPVALYAGDLAALERSLEMLLEHATRHALAVWHALGRCMQAVLLVKHGDVDAETRVLRPAFDELREAKFSLHYTGWLAALAKGLGDAGRVAEGLAAIDEAIERSERTEERWSMAELLRVKGELLLLQGAPDAATTAENLFLQALDGARRQEVLSWELRGATSLARLWHQHRRTSQARELLAPVYDRFTEGFATADLITAKTLLEAFRQQGRSPPGGTREPASGLQQSGDQ